MRPRPTVVWFIVLVSAFALGYFVTRYFVVQPAQEPVQNQPAPSRAPAQ